MSNNLPKNTEKYGRDELGKFTIGNNGKPKGATNKNTRDLRDFITGFLNDKSQDIPTLWDTLDDKDKLTLFMHLCRLVLPKSNEDNDRDPAQQLERRPIITFVDSGLNQNRIDKP
jgi:hypothetical protein